MRPYSQPCLSCAAMSRPRSARDSLGRGSSPRSSPCHVEGRLSSPNHKPAQARKHLRSAWADAAWQVLGVPSPPSSARQLEGQSCMRACFASLVELSSGKARRAWTRLPGHVQPAAAALYGAKPRRAAASLGAVNIFKAKAGVYCSRSLRAGGEEMKEIENGKFGFLFLTWCSAACASP